MLLSIVVPLYNEEGNIQQLYDEIVNTFQNGTYAYEIIFINDGSTDGSEAIIADIASRDSLVKVVNFRRNHGQTAALMAAFQHATGDIIVPLDGDLQNDPRDIPKLVEKIGEGYSVVSGWRKDRKDAELRRNLPSRLANFLISEISGVRLHDYGCTLKAYRRDVVADIKLYGEMHRFIPIYASWHGAKITEVPVNHRPRIHGTSNYGMERVIKVLLDLVVVKFLNDYHTKPIYMFGAMSILCLMLSVFSGLWSVYLKVWNDISFISTPLPLLVVLLLLVGVISLLLGLLAELMIRIYYEAQDKKTYYVKNTINFPESD